MTTTIRCAASSGKVEIDDDNALWWFVNDDDGLGQLVWHLSLPPALLHDLGANTYRLVEALNARGLGLAVEGTADRQQQLARMRDDDERLRWGGPR